jgi:hypothetical protein
VEEGLASNADDDQWLCCEEGEDDATEDGGEENLVDTVAVVGFDEHV